MFEERKGEGARLGVQTEAGLQVLLEEDERGEFAGADAEGFEVERLYEGDEGSNDEEGERDQEDHEEARSMRPCGRPKRARQRRSALAMRREPGVWS